MNTDTLTAEIFNACADLPETVGCRVLCLWEILVGMADQPNVIQPSGRTTREVMAAIATQMTGRLPDALASDVRAWIGVPPAPMY